MHNLIWDFCPSDQRFARELVFSSHPASFRFHLTMDTLAFGYILPTTGRIRDFNPLETCAARRTAQKRPKRALSLLSLYTLLANVFCFHFSAWSWGFFLLNRILWILRLFFLFFNNSFCRFMDLSLETDALWMDEDAQSRFFVLCDFPINGNFTLS